MARTVTWTPANGPDAGQTFTITDPTPNAYVLFGDQAGCAFFDGGQRAGFFNGCTHRINDLTSADFGNRSNGEISAMLREHKPTPHSTDGQRTNGPNSVPDQGPVWGTVVATGWPAGEITADIEELWHGTGQRLDIKPLLEPNVPGGTGEAIRDHVLKRYPDGRGVYSSTRLGPNPWPYDRDAPGSNQCISQQSAFWLGALVHPDQWTDAHAVELDRALDADLALSMWHYTDQAEIYTAQMAWADNVTLVFGYRASKPGYPAGKNAGGNRANLWDSQYSPGYHDGNRYQGNAPVHIAHLSVASQVCGSVFTKGGHGLLYMAGLMALENALHIYYRESNSTKSERGRGWYMKACAWLLMASNYWPNEIRNRLLFYLEKCVAEIENATFTIPYADENAELESIAGSLTHDREQPLRGEAEGVEPKPHEERDGETEPDDREGELVNIHTVDPSMGKTYQAPKWGSGTASAWVASAQEWEDEHGVPWEAMALPSFKLFMTSVVADGAMLSMDALELLFTTEAAPEFELFKRCRLVALNTFYVMVIQAGLGSGFTSAMTPVGKNWDHYPEFLQPGLPLSGTSASFIREGYQANTIGVGARFTLPTVAEFALHGIGVSQATEVAQHMASSTNYYNYSDSSMSMSNGRPRGQEWMGPAWSLGVSDYGL